MASQLSRAPLLDERDSQAAGGASVIVPQGVQGGHGKAKQQQLGVHSNLSSRFLPSPPDAIALSSSLKEKQSLPSQDSRALTFLRKLDHTFINSAVKEDVTFLVDQTERIQAHRFILASKSPVFRKMFESEMKESQTGVIEILDASAAVIRAMVEFCYSAEVSFTGQVYPDEVLKVAHKYYLPELKCEAECELLKRLTEANVVEALELSCTYEAEIVKQTCVQYLAHSMRLNSHNLCLLLRVSYTYDIYPLKVRAIEHFKQNFDSLKFVVFDDLFSS